MLSDGATRFLQVDNNDQRSPVPRPSPTKTGQAENYRPQNALVPAMLHRRQDLTRLGRGERQCYRRARLS